MGALSIDSAWVRRAVRSGGGDVRDEIAIMTPRLRRYARALVSGGSGPCELADTLVHATLMRAIGARSLGRAGDLPIRLYATVTQLHRDLAPAARPGAPAGAIHRPPSSCAPAPAPVDRLASALLDLPLDEREALLLVALEGFDHADAARILRIARPVLFERLTRARTALGHHLDRPVAIRPPVARAPHLRLVVG